MYVRTYFRTENYSHWIMSLTLTVFGCIISIIYAVVSDNHQSTYYQQWCSDNAKKTGYCKYLDDTGCNKYFPSSYDQEFMWYVFNLFTVTFNM